MDKLKEYIKPGDYIADLGCSEEPGWYSFIPGNCRIDAFDIRNIAIRRPNTEFYKANIELLYREADFKEKYDVAVANHIFEHVSDAEKFAQSIAHILKLNGLVHVAVPDAADFADCFYRLVFRGGGHIQRFTNDDLTGLMAKYGFELIEKWPWEEDYGWLKNVSGNLEPFGLSMMEPDEIIYIADVLKKELNKEKGYWYGWGMVFKKAVNMNIMAEDIYAAPEIVEIYPSQAVYGEGFLVQPNGLSALAVRGKNLTYGISICFEERELETDYDGKDTLTACIPKELLFPGKHKISLSYLSRNVAKEHIFEVVER